MKLSALIVSLFLSAFAFADTAAKLPDGKIVDLKLKQVYDYTVFDESLTPHEYDYLMIEHKKGHFDISIGSSGYESGKDGDVISATESRGIVMFTIVSYAEGQKVQILRLDVDAKEKRARIYIVDLAAPHKAKLVARFSGGTVNFDLKSPIAKTDCAIKDVRSASACMAKLAKAEPEYEEPNDGLASARKDLLLELMGHLGKDSAKNVKAVKEADFVGVMVVHMDEHHLVYYTMKKGANVKPVELMELNVADLSYADAYKSDPYPSADLFFIGANGKKIDVYSELESALEQAFAEANNQ